MERVYGMPILVKIIDEIEDKRWGGQKLIVGNEYELTTGDFEWLVQEHPECVKEIEMTREDWIRRGTERALKCKKLIVDMENKGVRFESYYTSVIPHGDLLVDGTNFGGGLPDAYDKVKLLERDVIKHMSKTPKFNVVEEMPIRIAVTKKIEKESIIIEPGTVIDISLYDLEFFNKNFEGFFSEIEMTREDWIQLATTNALKSQKRITELEMLYDKKFESHYTSVIPQVDFLVDGTGFGGGLSDAYNKTKCLEKDIEQFEKECLASLKKDTSIRH